MSRRPTIRDLIANLKATRTALEAELLQVAEEVALIARTLAERNSIQDGIKQGTEDYSTHEVPAFFFMGKELNNKGRDEVKRRMKNKEGLTWGQFRDVQGLPDAHVTLSYTNEMWRGIVVVRTEKRGSRYFAILGHRTKAGQDKMNWNFDRYGDFIGGSLTENNRSFLVRFVGEKIVSILKQKGLTT